MSRASSARSALQLSSRAANASLERRGRAAGAGAEPAPNGRRSARVNYADLVETTPKNVDGAVRSSPQLTALAQYLEACGGSASMVDGWPTKTETRRGRIDCWQLRYFFDPSGKRYRSRIDVALHFKLNVDRPAHAARRTAGAGDFRWAAARRNIWLQVRAAQPKQPQQALQAQLTQDGAPTWASSKRQRRRRGLSRFLGPERVAELASGKRVRSSDEVAPPLELDVGRKKRARGEAESGSTAPAPAAPPAAPPPAAALDPIKTEVIDIDDDDDDDAPTPATVEAEVMEVDAIEVEVDDDDDDDDADDAAAAVAAAGGAEAPKRRRVQVWWRATPPVHGDGRPLLPTAAATGTTTATGGRTTC